MERESQRKTAFKGRVGRENKTNRLRVAAHTLAGVDFYPDSNTATLHTRMNKTKQTERCGASATTPAKGVIREAAAVEFYSPQPQTATPVER